MKVGKEKVSVKLLTTISFMCNLFVTMDTSFIRPNVKVDVKRTVGLLS
jgi:hypothetical protein